MSAKILIAGAGDIGTRLGRRLREQGNEVFALRRHAAKLPTELVQLEADLADLETLRALPRGLTHVAYTAAADERTDAAYERAYVIGLSNVLEALRTSGSRAPRVVFISSTAVYAQDADEWVDEASATLPTSFSGTRTLEAEATLASSGFDYCILRCGGIYGPGRTRLIDQVRSGQASFDPRSPQYTNRIHADDVAGALALLLMHPGAGGLYNGVDEYPAPRREVLGWLAEQLGAPSPTPSEQAPSRSAGSKRVLSRRLRELGYVFRYPTFREGYAALLGDD